MSKQWYDCIEPEIREIVRLLRDNGFNTYSSCGHEMYVQLDIICGAELDELHNLLHNNGYPHFQMTVEWESVFPFRRWLTLWIRKGPMDSRLGNGKAGVTP